MLGSGAVAVESTMMRVLISSLAKTLFLRNCRSTRNSFEFHLLSFFLSEVGFHYVGLASLYLAM